MDLDLYVGLMNEVKNRTIAITQILNKQKTTSFQATNIEFMCLQIRKILELISLGSLVANKQEFEKEQIKYQKFWHAEKILKDIERLNPDFYPRPILEKQSDKPNVKRNLVDKKDENLTKTEFVKVYVKCGKIMHADNPFGSKVELEFYEKQIVLWLDKIIGLLNSHMIKLKGHDNFYLIHMQEDRDELVHGYDFERMD